MQSGGSYSALIALGANLPSKAGSPLDAVTAAIRELDALGVSVKRIAAWRRSPAFPPGSGPDFVNGAAMVQTDGSAEELLAAMHEVERRLGRERPERWAPRVADLDLLAIEDWVLPDLCAVRQWMDLPPERARVEAPDALILPHPRLHERNFVLAPLADIAPDWRHPVLDRTVLEMRDALGADALSEITLWTD